MRLTWQSKIVSGSRVCPVDHLSQSQICRFAFRLALRKVVAEAVVSGECFSSLSWLRSVIQPSPIASVISLESAGLHSSSQRRGVTPFVLLLNRLGKDLCQIF